MDKLQLKIALSIIPKIGPRLVRRMVSYAGGIEAVFEEKKQILGKVPGIGEGKAGMFRKDELLRQAEREMHYIQKSGIQPLFYLDKQYPLRLKECEDAPVVLYVRGEVQFNSSKVISIVGTRKATEYGKTCTDEIINYLAANYPDLIIVSGLAYGIDITAHKAALRNNIKTIAVLGHGFEFLYPSLHASYAKKIREQGALVTEFQSGRKPDPGNFVSRNRIIAGLTDATIVAESASRGGALITADLANSYNRDVFAIPGRRTDTYSKGCNTLIRLNRAALVETGKDIEYSMGWNKEKKQGTIQKSLFHELTPEEEKIMKFLKPFGEATLDEISIGLELPLSKISSSLLNLEFNGLVRSLPGKCYKPA